MITVRRLYNPKPRVFVSFVLGFLLVFPKVTATAYAQKWDNSLARHDVSPPLSRPPMKDWGEENEHLVLKYLVPALNKAGKVGRIYYAADCLEDEGTLYYPYPFPAVDVQRPSKDASGRIAVQEIFQHASNVAIEEKPSGIIRIRIGKVTDDLLQTKITRLIFKPDEQYEPLFAIGAIQDSAEIAAAAKKLNLRFFGLPMSGPRGGPKDGPPPDSLTDITMDQALDVVAKTFGDIVEYRACKNKNHVDVDATGGRHLPWYH